MNDLPELPQIVDPSVKTLRLKDTLLKRMPPLPSGNLQDLYFTNVRQLEAEQYANDIRAAYDISRQIDQRSRAIAKARNYQNQKRAEQSLKLPKTFANR